MEKEVLLKVENLQQYYTMKKWENKAVDKVSFEIYKGEVFGLVGESGCGKTTTGRSIIRLYDITGGSVYYKGERICAGTRSYEDAIKQARADFKDGKITKEQRDEIVAKNRAEIKSAIADHKKYSRAKGENKLTIQGQNEPMVIKSITLYPAEEVITYEDYIADLTAKVGTLTAGKDEILAIVKADEKIAAALDGKTIVKEIVVPGKIINIVVK